MTAPSDADDVTWMNNALKDRAPRIKIHDVDAAVEDEEESASGEQALKIDWGALG